MVDASLSDSNNYRGIALNTTISKLFGYVIFENMLPKIQENNYQFGFKSYHYTTLCSFILSQTIQYYNKLGSNVYRLFLDASKAFDKVKHDKLLECLLKKNVCSLIVRIILKMYSMRKLSVKCHSKPLDVFLFSHGIKKGES